MEHPTQLFGAPRKTHDAVWRPKSSMDLDGPPVELHGAPWMSMELQEGARGSM